MEGNCVLRASRIAWSVCWRIFATPGIRRGARWRCTRTPLDRVNPKFGKTPTSPKTGETWGTHRPKRIFQLLTSQLVQHRFAQGADAQGLSSQREYQDFVFPFLQILGRDVEGLLWADVPEPAQGMTVDPHCAFAQASRGQKSVAERFQIEVFLVKGRTG